MYTVLEHATRQHLTLIDIIPISFDGPVCRAQIHVSCCIRLAIIPGGIYRLCETQLGRAKYAQSRWRNSQKAIANARRRSEFIAETLLPSVGGQIVFPPNYLAEGYSIMCIPRAGCMHPLIESSSLLRTD